MRLEDRVAIITGAGSGSGRAGALIFAKEAARVVVTDIDPKGGEETVKMVKEQGGEAIFAKIDVGKLDDIQRMIDTAVDTYGKINIMWNHAGIPGPGFLEETEEADFVRSWEVNFKGTFFAVKFAVPHMKKAGCGSIIFTASIAALSGSPYSASYSSFKGSLVTLTYTLATHLGPHNIRVNSICPGLIDTPMARVFLDRSGTMGAEALDKAIQDFGKNKSPMGRTARPEDIANAALFLASDEAAYVNGVILPVDGGTVIVM